MWAYDPLRAGELMDRKQFDKAERKEGGDR